MQHYLTKWELYILFKEYLRFQQIEFSPAVYCFKVRRQLDTLRKQPFFKTYPDVTEEVFKKILRTKNADIIRDKSHCRHFGVYFHNIKILRSWLEDYLIDYKADKLHSRRELFCTYRQSMRHTLDLLRNYFNINEKIITLKPEMEDGEGKILRVNTRTRLYEDILFMIQYGCLSLNDVFLQNTKVLIDTDNKDEVPIFSIKLRFLKTMDEIEQFICSTGVESRKLSNNNSNKQTEKEISDIPSPYNLFKIEQTDPAEIETETIFYRGKPLPLKYGTKEYKLLHFLIRNKRPVTHAEVLNEIGIQFYQKTSHKTDEEQIIDKIKVLKNYCSHLRAVLGWGVELVNSKGNIYLK